MVKYLPEHLDRVFAALSDPSRRTILESLTQGEASVSELAQPLGISLPAVLKHLRVLEEAGLLVCRKEGRTRWCRLAGRPLLEAVLWINRYEAFWQTQFDSLSTYLGKAHKEE